MSADDPRILIKLKEMMGKENPWTRETLHVNSTYNDLTFCYWYYFDDYLKNAMMPNRLTSITGIDRAIRSLPNRETKISIQQRVRKYYKK